jgi:polyvinyl alcohol dehydrogenase (cytochrome)
MSGAGPAIVDGHVVINSGYGLYNHEPGNLLMVFAAPEQEVSE